MRKGVVYPQIELGGDVGAVRAFAQAAEDLGYDHFLMYDHVLGAEHARREPALWGPYTEKDPFHEPFISFAYLAGITRRLEFMTGVIVLPQRQTALVAKQAADLDLFSGGRLRLGVGAGWNWVEFDALEVGEHFARRGKREEQQIELMRRLWTEELVSYDDGVHKVERANILPRPERSIPIWLGGFSKVAFNRAVRIADGFLFSGRSQGEAVDVMKSMQDKLVENGRLEGFGFESICGLAGGVDAWHENYQNWQAAGGTHVSVVTMGMGYKTVDEHIEAIRSTAEVCN